AVELGARGDVLVTACPVRASAGFQIPAAGRLMLTPPPPPARIRRRIRPSVGGCAPAPPGTARAGIAALTRPPPAPILPARLRPLPTTRTRARFDLAGGAHHGGGAVLARSAILGAGIGVGREPT